MAEAVTTIERQHVDVTELPVALAELWSQVEASDDVPICRALTLNLIAVTDAEHEDQLREAVDRLLVRHPCRAFIVIVEGDDRHGVRAELGASVRCTNRSRQTELEQITLRAPRSGFAVIPSLIRPLVVNDIPVHLFWATALPDSAWDLTTMARIADQTIVHSCRFADPVGDLQRVQEMPEVAVKDLAQFQLRPWRRALASAFECFEWNPKVATTVSLSHGPACGARAASYLLSRWLFERLHADTELSSIDTGASPDAEPARLELQHGDVHIAVEHLIDDCKLRTTVTLADRCLMPFVTPASRGRVGDLLAAAIDSL